MKRLSGTVRPCRSCTVSILRSFTALSVSSPPIPQLRPRHGSQGFPSTLQYSSRRYVQSNAESLYSQQLGRGDEAGRIREAAEESRGSLEDVYLAHEALEEEHEHRKELEEGDEEGLKTRQGSSPDQSNLPWYLRDENAQQPLRNDYNRKELPPLPENAPDLLRPLLDHVYEELGIDDLVLQDLRNIRPAPALGSNLLMIIGTARSEKHLHISADRLCRWLRTNHKLRPFADGLLGRNELKIKLRRKARRARLMSAAGGKESGNVDDGIRTGWVCVNIGKVDSGESEMLEDTIPNFIGFGKRSEGTQIVVQMLTEAKREEIDLEGLWNPIIEHNKKKSDPLEADSVEADLESVPAGLESSKSLYTAGTGSSFLGRGTSRPAGSTSMSTGQIRSVHTTLRLSGHHLLSRIHGGFDEWETLLSSRQEPADSTRNVGRPSQAKTQVNTELQKSLSEGDYKHVRQILLLPGKKAELGLTDDDSKSLMLRTLLVHLKNLPNEQALQSLGMGSNDFASTQFLLSFYQTLPAFASDDHWHAKLAMICYARKLGHPGYQGSAIANVVRQMQLSAVPVTEEAYFLALETILSPWASTDQQLRLAEGLTQETAEERLDAVLMVMETMSLQQPQLFSEENIVRLLKSMPVLDSQKQADPSPTTPGSPAMSANSEQKRVVDLMRLHGAKVIKDTTWYELFFLYSERKQWTAFWDLWYQRARLGRRRDNGFYNLMFALIAISGHQAACMEVLRSWVPAMANETPPVKPDEGTTRAIRECILTADPGVLAKLEKDAACNDEWAVAWRKTSSRL